MIWNEEMRHLNEVKRNDMHKKLRITYNAPVVLSMVAISFLATLLNYITRGVLGQAL